VPFVAPEELSVVLGVNDLTQTPAGQRIAVAQIVAHPEFDIATAYDADVALLRLAAPAVPNARVQVLPLVTAFDGALQAPGVPATVTGWGTRTAGQGDYPDLLYQVAVPIVDPPVCAFTYAAKNLLVNGNMLCAGLAAGGKDSCQGDSGGPLVVRAGNGWKQAGIVSWGEGCGLPGLPGIYTRLTQFLGYIGDVQNTLATRAYFVSDGTGLPGHAAQGEGVVTTLVKPLRTFLPVIGKR
jgi:secreted trypsin-like serine protease